MHPRLQRTLALGLGLLLLGGILLSGSVHAVVHADDPAPCVACTIAGDTPEEPALEPDPLARIRVAVEVRRDLPLVWRGVSPRAPRGPPCAS